MSLTSEPNAERLRTILANTRTIAVLGAHTEVERPAHFVAAYLAEHGYRVLPVNARYAGQSLWGQEVVGDLRQLGEPIDVVDVFRRADALDQHLDEIFGMQPLPRVVWLQKGIRNDAFAERLRAAGIEVVQDRCMMAEHRKLS